MLQALFLATQGHAATQRNHLDVGGGAGQAPDFSGDLIGQLACGAHHQRLHRVKVGGEFFNQWQTKGSGFAAARAGLGDEVFARQRHWQARCLNGGHLGVAELVEVGEGFGG